MATRPTARARLRPRALRHTLADLASTGSDTTELEAIAAAARRRNAAGVGPRAAPADATGVVLFHGRSPTNRLAAAEALAAALDAPLYRVDLSQVVSPHLGETERNLATVFDTVAGAGAVLLFDEADALFGKRTGVRDANDRYANIEVSYLLRRVDAHDGVAILAVDGQAAPAALESRVRWRVAIPARTVRPPRPRG